MDMDTIDALLDACKAATAEKDAAYRFATLQLKHGQAVFMPAIEIWRILRGKELAAQGRMCDYMTEGKR